jgi:hypothetical protein
VPERFTISALVTPGVMALRVLASPACRAGTSETVYEVRTYSDRGERPMVIDPVCRGNL